MSGDEKKDKAGAGGGELVVRAAAAGVAVAAGVALVPTIGSPLATVLGGVFGTLFPDLISALEGMIRGANERKAEKYFRSLLVDDATEDEARGRVEGFQKRENAAAVIAAHARELANTIDEAVIPAIAALSRDYALRDAPPDRFFRNATSLLSALSADEALAVRAIFEAGTAEGRSDPFVIALSAGKGRFGAPGEGLVNIEWLVPSEGPRIPVECTPVSLGLLDELRRSGIASVGYGGYYGVSSGPNIAVVSKETALRMLTLLKWVR